MRDAQSALRNVTAALEAGLVPSLADRIALEQALEGDPQPSAEAPAPVDTTPHTSRPQPAPEPEVPVIDPLAPGVEPEEMDPLDPSMMPLAQIMTSRATLMNPQADPEKIKAVVRRAMAYLR